MKNILKFAIFILFFSCSEDSNQEEKLEIMPLAINNYWGFDEINYNEDGTIKDTSIGLTSFEYDTVINKKKYYCSYLSTGIYHNNDNGLYLNFLINTRKEDWLFLKYPCSVGDTWEFKYAMAGTIVVRSLNKLVSVPYGSFECIEYEYSYKNINNNNDTIYNQYYIYAKPGLGIILEKHFEKINYDGEYKIKTNLELVELDLK